MSDTTATRGIELTGRIAPSRIREIHPARVSADVLEAFRALGDLSSAVSDALDELGLPGAIAASAMPCSNSGARVVGTALTLRNEPRVESVGAAVAARRNGMADMECHNLARPGDILVIQGVAHASNLGGVSSRLGKRQGEAGAIVEGGVRDAGDFRANDYPVWSSGITPQTGKWRIEAAEINGPVSIRGVRVHPGDLVVADSTGICFVPRARAEEVLALVRRKLAAEQDACRAIDSGCSVPRLAAGALPPIPTSGVSS